MLKKRLLFLTFNRRQSNFVATAGFDKKTAEKDYAKRIAIVDDKTSLSYAQLNEKVGRYASLLHGKYGLQVDMIEDNMQRTTRSMIKLGFQFGINRRNPTFFGASYIY